MPASSIRFLLIASVLLGCLPCSAQANLDNMNFILGKWEGTGWMMTRTGKEFTHITEHAQCKAGCTVIAIEGLGVATDSTTMEQRIVHDAFGVLFVDETDQQIKMRAYKDGQENVSAIEFLSDKKIRWVLQIPGGNNVRFTADYSVPGKWSETGEFSRDGQNWMQIMEMHLDKVAD